MTNQFKQSELGWSSWTFRDLSSILPVLLHCTVWKNNQVDSSEAVYLVIYPQFTTILRTNLVIVHLFCFPTGNYLVYMSYQETSRNPDK